MKKQYFNEFEFKKALLLYGTDPLECKNRYEEYLKKYPQDYHTYTYYVGVLIELGEFEYAEKVLNYTIEISNNDNSFSKEKNKLKQLQENLLYCKLRLLSYTEKYEELYKLCSDNYGLIKKISLNNVYFYAKTKNNMIDSSSRENVSYCLRQMIEYKETDFLKHVKKHLADCVTDLDNPNKNLFAPDFPIEKVINETRKYIPSNKCLFPGIIENMYVFKYTSCGKDNNKTVDYFKVVCFHNTQNYITMFPCVDCENLPYVDLDYLINTNDIPKVKTLSQIEKFNKRFNNK